MRIENVELIKDVETKYNFHGIQFMTMEPLTLVSIDNMQGIFLVSSTLNGTGSYPVENDGSVTSE